MAQYERTLDAKGLTCPLPLLKVRQSLSDMCTDDVLHIEATDPGSWRDFESFVAQAGHALLRQEERDGVFYYSIAKGAGR
ncbi:sulfurtransferase TusA family protein [Larsenimonas salina]|uniref:sulfurtransferase TusA family protein n=1 Tax=Larsenimonas salina TaxID=1295565 RepID=UPI0020730B09|nr:sulfurtransferase TusA family protein [Larsenimonas salina]